MEAISSIKKKSYTLIPQDESIKTFAPKLRRQDGQISWDDSSESIYNQIRGCLGWPDAFTFYNDKLLKIFKARVTDTSGCRLPVVPGKILEVSREGIAVAAGKGCIFIEELQIEGKRRMKAEEFIAGHKIQAGEQLGNKK